MDSIIGIVSYAAATVAYLILALLLVTSWRGRLQGMLFTLATLATCGWALLILVGYFTAIDLTWIFSLEAVRNTLWALFFLALLNAADGERLFKGKYRIIAVSIVGLGAALIVFLAYFRGLHTGFGNEALLSLVLPGFLLFSLIGIVLVEQLYRNVRPERRWAIKYLCLAISGLFVYDFVFYSQALLYRSIDVSLWEARGYIYAMIVPLLAVSAARNTEWSLDIFVSRGVVFHVSALLTAASYLLVMIAGGYYIRYFGGSWGGVAQAVFWFASVIVLIMLMSSGHMRARLRVFLDKHFFSYRYDYRNEWLRITEILSDHKDGLSLHERVMRGVAATVDSPGGILWLKQGTHGLDYEVVEHIDMPSARPVSIMSDDSLIHFFQTKNWIINLKKYDEEDAVYKDLHLPVWMRKLPGAWLIVPLYCGELLGVMVLAESRAIRSFNWEDSDLIKVVSSQVAVFIAQNDAMNALSEARQFEAYNRMSTYILHDMKNLVAQLSLLVRNSKKHKDSQEFVDDMIVTVDNAVTKMNELMMQLRSGMLKSTVPVKINLSTLLKEVVMTRSDRAPYPEFKDSDVDVLLIADQARLVRVFKNLIQNAQEATSKDGLVKVVLHKEGPGAIVEVIDTGCGMDALFIKERLFKPFDSTKSVKGVGIGVYESRDYIRELGGEIYVVSTPGKGTRFSIRFPIKAV